MYYEFKKAPNIVKMLGCPHDVVTRQGLRLASAAAIGGSLALNEVIAYYDAKSDVLIIPNIHKYAKFQSVLEFHVIFQLI